MKTQSQIEALIASGDLDAAQNAIAGLDDEATAAYLSGRLAWKRGLKAEAMTFYAKSEALDPAGPGATALEQARQIMNFYNKDLYNP